MYLIKFKLKVLTNIMDIPFERSHNEKGDFKLMQDVTIRTQVP